MRLIILHIIFLLVFGTFSVSAQIRQGSATAKLDSTTLIIGDQARFELSVTVPAGSRLEWPLFPDTLVRNVEILRRSAPDTVSSDREQFTLRQELIITSFDSGYYVVPPIRFRYTLKGDTVSNFAETTPVQLYVNTVAVNQNEDIKPIKPPLKAPVTLREILKWVGILLLVAALAFVVYYFFIRKKKKEPVVVTRLTPGLPPDEAALQAFENLRSKKLWQSGRVKEYYSELTEIVREYIELRFPVKALEMTTAEITTALTQVDINHEAREKLNRTLTLADLVKFAKEQPLPVDNDMSLGHCIDFVRETRPARSTDQVNPVKTSSNPVNPES